MPSPFPGMDPYLESPRLWPDVHHSLISAIRAQLNPQLRPKYVARVEERVYVSDEGDPGRRAIVPDVHVVERRGDRIAGAAASSVANVAEPVPVVELLEQEVHEPFVEILSASGRDVVAVIEVLSPANKTRGARGRDEYEAKRRQVMHSGTHLVEIDLLRQGDPVFAGQAVPAHDYGVYLSRAVEGTRERRGLFWPILLRQRLPAVHIPLRAADADVAVDLQAVLDAIYDEASYDADLDYRAAPDVPLSYEAAHWAEGVLRAKGLR
jgi:hypothetical protein